MKRAHLVLIALAVTACCCAPATSEEFVDPDGLSGGLPADDAQAPPESPSTSPPPQPADAVQPVPGGQPERELRAYDLPVIARVVPGCGCTSGSCDFEPDVAGIRETSDLMDGGTSKSPIYTNMVWSWGQFLDHDFIATFSDESQRHEIEIPGHDSLKVKRVDSECDGKCRQPKSVTTPQIDGGPIYSNLESYTNEILREPQSCKLRTSAGNFPPVTTHAATRETEAGPVTKHFFLAGDARVDEHAILTNMHTMWLREHNRLCDEVASAHAEMSGDEAFKLVRAVIIAKMQEITLFEWLPALGVSPEEVFHWTPLRPHLKATAEISTEFLLAYRWGHTGVPNTIADFDLSAIFDGEAFYSVTTAAGPPDPAKANADLNRLVQATATEPMADLDGHMADALRNMLFGRGGLDLGSFNIFRARDIALPGYADLAKCYGVATDPQAATDDPFVGTVQEPPAAGTRQAFGPLLRRILIDQFHRVLFGPQGNWWGFSDATARYSGRIVGTKLADIIRANTDASVPDAAFLLPGAQSPRLVKPQGGAQGGSPRGKVATGGSAVKDVATAAPADPDFRP